MARSSLWMDHGMPFETHDLGSEPLASTNSPLSSFSQQIEASIFESLLPFGTLSEAHDGSNTLTSHFAFHEDLKGAPEQNVARDLGETPGSPVQAEESSSVDDAGECDGSSIWDFDPHFEAMAFAHPPCTWEEFEKKTVPEMEHFQYLSEAGPLAFDAVVRLFDRYSGKETAVFPHDFALRALCNLTLGRSSVLFRWSDAKQEFSPCLQDLSFSGSSQMCSGSLVADLRAFGTTIVRLRNFAERQSSTAHNCVALVALRCCVEHILDSIDAYIAPELQRLKSILQLQQLVRVPCQLIQILFSLVEGVGECETNESLISIVADRVSLLAFTSPEFCEVFQTLLSQISLPWMERLMSDLGLGGGQATVVDHAEEINLLAESKDVSLRFVDDADKTLVQQTRAALLLLRAHGPMHSHDLRAYTSRSSTWSNDTGCPLDRLASGHKRDVQRPQQPQTDEREMYGPLVEVEQSPPHTSVDILTEHGWYDESSQERYVESLGDVMSQRMTQQQCKQNSTVLSSDMQSRVNTALNRDQSAEALLRLPLDACLDTSILQPLRPRILSQHDASNNAALHLLLHRCDLMQHLDLQRSFQLLGCGDFIVRLSTALFSPEVQSAERTRGVIPTAQVMGLRLDANRTQRWPPASSELRLALSGVLADSYAALGTPDDSTSKEMPGALSFSIRELPDAEIDRLTDPGSIYALDFLRLQYTPPKPLDVIITPAILDDYDQIFRFLLKFVRLAYITKELQHSSRRSAASVSSPHTQKLAFSLAHSLRQLILTLMTHFMDVAIDTPWQDLRASIHHLHLCLNPSKPPHPTTLHNPSITTLHTLHATCLTRIRTRLYLKRAQARLHAALLDLLTTIMTSASALTAVTAITTTTSSSTIHSLPATLRAAVTRFCTLLHDAADHTPRRAAAAKTDLDEAQVSQILLAKLKWNGYF